MGTVVRLIGKRVYLRKIRVEDAGSRYLGWMRDREVNRYLECRFSRYTLKKLRDYVVAINRRRDHLFFAIVLREGNEHIGNIKIGPIDPFHRRGEVGIVIGEKKCWGKGLATEAIRLAADYCFGSKRLRRLTAGAYRNNGGSVRAFEKAGFKIEGIRKGHFLCEGCFVDAIEFGLNRGRS